MRLCPGCHATAGQHVTHKRTKWGSCGHLSSLVLLTFTLKLCLNSYKWKQQWPKIWAGISRFNPNKGSINKNIQQTDRKACHGFLLLSILCSITATSKHTLQKTFHSGHSLSLIGAARREHFHTFAPWPFLVHKAALFLAHNAVVLYGWWVQIKYG